MKKPNRELLSGGKKYLSKKKISINRVDEVVFNTESRIEYLTGFHKRKVERKKKAEAFNKEQDRLNRIEERRQIREERQKTIQEQLEKYNALIREEAKSDSDDDEETNDKKKKAVKLKEENENENENEQDDSYDSDQNDQNDQNKVDIDGENEEHEEWNGFDSNSTSIITKPILKKRTVLQFISSSKNLENTPVDGETIVTVEPLNMNGYDSDPENSASFEDIAKANFVDLTLSSEILRKSVDRARTYAKFVETTQPNEFKNESQKNHRKKFRYLSKNERKENRRKISLKKAKRRQ